MLFTTVRNGNVFSSFPDTTTWSIPGQNETVFFHTFAELGWEKSLERVSSSSSPLKNVKSRGEKFWPE